MNLSFALGTGFVIVDFLNHYDGCIPLNELAVELGIPQDELSTAVDNLVELGSLKRCCESVMINRDISDLNTYNASPEREQEILQAIA